MSGVCDGYGNLVVCSERLVIEKGVTLVVNCIHCSIIEKGFTLVVNLLKVHRQFPKRTFHHQ